MSGVGKICKKFSFQVSLWCKFVTFCWNRDRHSFHAYLILEDINLTSDLHLSHVFNQKQNDNSAQFECFCVCLCVCDCVCVCWDRNLLEYLPDWVCDCRKIEMLDVTHNLLSELPSRLLAFGFTNPELFVLRFIFLCYIIWIHSALCNINSWLPDADFRRSGVSLHMVVLFNGSLMPNDFSLHWKILLC